MGVCAPTYILARYISSSCSGMRTQAGIVVHTETETDRIVVPTGFVVYARYIYLLICAD